MHNILYTRGSYYNIGNNVYTYIIYYILRVSQIERLQKKKIRGVRKRNRLVTAAEAQTMVYDNILLYKTCIPRTPPQCKYIHTARVYNICITIKPQRYKSPKILQTTKKNVLADVCLNFDLFVCLFGFFFVVYLCTDETPRRWYQRVYNTQILVTEWRFIRRERLIYYTHAEHRYCIVGT